MSTQRGTPHPIETLLTWVKSSEIAIPEIQRLVHLGGKSRGKCFAELAEQVTGGKKKYGGSNDEARPSRQSARELYSRSDARRRVPVFDEFLAERRRLMALMLKRWFEAL